MNYCFGVKTKDRRDGKLLKMGDSDEDWLMERQFCRYCIFVKTKIEVRKSIRRRHPWIESEFRRL